MHSLFPSLYGSTPSVVRKSNKISVRNKRQFKAEDDENISWKIALMNKKNRWKVHTHSNSVPSGCKKKDTWVLELMCFCVFYFETNLFIYFKWVCGKFSQWLGNLWGYSKFSNQQYRMDLQFEDRNQSWELWARAWWDSKSKSRQEQLAKKNLQAQLPSTVYQKNSVLKQKCLDFIYRHQVDMLTNLEGSAVHI